MCELSIARARVRIMTKTRSSPPQNFACSAALLDLLGRPSKNRHSRGRRSMGLRSRVADPALLYSLLLHGTTYLTTYMPYIVWLKKLYSGHWTGLVVQLSTDRNFAILDQGKQKGPDLERRAKKYFVM